MAGTRGNAALRPGRFASLPCPLLVLYGRTSSNQDQTMKDFIKTIAALTVAFTGFAQAADDSVAGKWKAQFDSQIGTQKYTFEFKLDGDKLTGKAIGERETGTNDVPIVEGKIKGDEISFVEPLKLQDSELRI